MKKASRESQTPFNLTRKSLLIILSGPSGTGKDAVLSRMKKTGYPLEYIVTVTTRPKRAKERDNVDYRFVSAEKFQEMIKSNELLEWANVYGNWYGVPKQPIKQALDKGQDIIVKVDTQGAITIKKILPQSVFILLMPPSMAELSQRLTERHTETPFDLALRLKTAEEELKQIALFDYVIYNQRDDIDLAISDIKAIITAEKCRIIPREIVL